MKITTVASILIIVLSFLASAYAYPLMQGQIATHWNIYGEPNGYMPAAIGLFLLPIMSVILLLFFLVIPIIDPLKINYKAFGKYYDYFVLAMTGFLFYLNILSIVFNLGYDFNISQALTPGFAVLIFILGSLTENAKPNWFVGIRTPWTLSSMGVWDKTHKLGGKLFKGSAIISLVGLLFPDISMFFTTIPLIASAFYLFVYSYLEFEKEKAGKK